MPSSNALKYKVFIASSYYAGMIIFLLYCFVILLAFYIAPLSNLTLFFYLLLFLIASFAARKAYLQHDELLLSDSGLLERKVDELNYHGQINRASFYNGFFVFLILDIKVTAFTEKSTKQYIVIYKDAVSEVQYRLLARIISNGRN